MTEREIFFEALEATTPEERAAFVYRACARDDILRRRVEELLKEHFSGDSLLAGPAVEGERPVTVEFPVTDPSSRTLGRYKLLEKIGEGGFGEVWMAEQREPVKRRVALKLIKPGMDSRQIVARFEAERQALAMMDHPNIAKIFDAGTTGQEAENAKAGSSLTPDSCLLTPAPGRPYFVMELVRGIRITEYCDQNQLPTGERLKLFILVCHAIRHAHQKGIIHRDIKPSNILVTQHDGVPAPKVIDFGIARATQGELTDKTVFTQFQHFIGTPAYISPEQAEMSSLDIDTRADIYSLGVLLYELLVGQTPFDAREMMQGGIDALRRIIREKEPLRPSTRLNTLQGDARTTACNRRQTDPGKLVHQLQGDLDWIVMKCLEKDRVRRYETADGLASDIQRHLNNEAVLARPPGAAYRFQKMVRRNRLAFSAASAVMLTLIGGLSLSTWSFLREREAHAGESAQRRVAVEEQTKAEAARASEARQRSKADAEKTTAQRHLYAANMNLAQQAWEQNNIVRLQQLLRETQASPDRGFEWYYWQRQTHLAVMTFRGHPGPVWGVAFSPDGRRIVTGSPDQTAKIWDVASGRELLTLTGHSAMIGSVAFSPDGQRIVTGSWDQTARVWDAASGRELLPPLKGHSAPIRSVAFSPDGERIVTGSMDQSARVWDAANRRELLSLKGHSAGVHSAAFSPDGQRIVTGSGDKTVRVWDAASAQELLTLGAHDSQVESVAFSPDGRRIVTGGADRTAIVWDADSGRAAAPTGRALFILKHGDRIRSVAFSPDGRWIVTGSWDRTASVWEAASGGELLTLKGHTDGVESVAFSLDGRRIVTGSRDHTAKVWEVASGLSADQSGRELTSSGAHSAAVTSVGFSPDGQRVVTGSGDKTARVWDAASRRELLPLRGHGAGITSVAYSPDGLRIVSGSLDQTAKVWDAASGLEVGTFEGHTGLIWSAAFSPNGQRMVTGSWDQTAGVWEVATGRRLLSLTGHVDQVRSVAYSPDGERIVTGSGDQTARVWDAAGGRELLALKGHDAQVLCAAYSPDGRQIVTGSGDQTAKVWEAASGRPLLTLRGHGAPIGSAGFSPDGQRILTGSDDQTARIWDAASGRELLALKGHTGWIGSATFSPDGKRIVTGSVDRTAMLWEAARAEQVAAWQAEEQAAEQSLEGLQRERMTEEEHHRILLAGDEGAVKRWLILAPITLSTGRGPSAVDKEQIEGESQLQPKAGEREVTIGGELTWQEVALDDYVIDFNVLLGHRTTWNVAYAVCYIRSKAEQRGLQMLVGSGDGAKVYLNGKEIHKYPFTRGFVADHDRVPNIILNEGSNVLVFKVVNAIAAWKGSLRFTDANGNSVKGIEVTLDPDVKKQQ